MDITGRQIRAGRAGINISAAELAVEARLGRMTVVKSEQVDDVPPITKANLHAIRVALEARGVIFLEDGGVTFGST